MDNQVHNQIVSFIWGIADDCLRDVYVRGKYRDVILPMTVIRRLDAMLEETKPAVLAMKKQLNAAKIDNQWPALCNAAGQAFCNASPFLLKDLTSRAKAQTLKADFIAYLDGFSPNVQVILDKFKFRNQIDTMVDADILGAVIEKFTSSDINLSPNPIYKDDAKTILKHPGLDNHGMGTIFEELIRKFNEENNEEAGEHWTPRDVVELMADLVFMPIADKIKDASYSCYDGACGTGGMLTVAQDRLLMLAKRRGKEVAIHLFGQEVQPETYAICTADMLLKGDGEEAQHIMYGSTLSDDQHASRQFDFMLSNPPYGKSWKTDAEKTGGKKEILDTRFNTYLEGGDVMPMIPRTSDGQLLITGNHEKCDSAGFQACFESEDKFSEILDEGRKVFLCHYPILFFPGQHKDGYMLYGHVHTTQDYDLIEKWKADMEKEGLNSKIFNVGCMVDYMNYTPRTLDELIAFHSRG